MFGQYSPASRFVANNQVAAGDQQAAMRSSAGQGLSYGAGERSRDALRGGAAKAQGYGQAAATLADYRLQNATMYANQADRQRQFNLNEQQMRQQRDAANLDSRFNNLTTIWGALSGLLR